MSITHDITSTYVSGYSPLTINFNTSGFTGFTFPCCKLIYDFGDEETQTISRTLIPAADPKDILSTHTFRKINQEADDIFLVSISAVECNTFSTLVCTVSVEVELPGFIGVSAQHTFEKIHLINSRMFTTDNVIMYTFETENPNYFMTSVVDISGGLT